MKLSITHKLTAAFVGLTLIVLIATLGLARWSFEQGFLDYVNALEQVRLEQIAVELGEQYYLAEQTWEFLTEEQFDRLTRLASRDRGSDSPPRYRPPNRRESGSPPPPSRRKPGPPGPRGMPQTLPTALFDMSGNLVAGARIGSLDAPTIRVAVFANDSAVGELRSEPRRKFTSTVETDFSRQQLTTSWIIGVLCLALALGLSLLLARGFSAPVRRLINSVAELSRGNYSHRMNERRNDELGQLTNNLDRLGATLEANQHSRKRLLADVSHELRTPLTVLIGEIEALKDGLRNFDVTQLASLDQEVQRLRHLVDDLYELSVSDVGGLRYQFKPMDLVSCVKEAVEGERQRAVAQGIDIAMDESELGEYIGPIDQKILLEADSQRIDQLLLNLLENSLAYTDAPGGLLISVFETDGNAVISIDDTAPGVNEGDYEQLFDPLYRQESSRSRRTGGAGLGLAVCRNIVTAHGGTIVASPSKLGGVCIRVEVPLSGASEV